MMFVQSLLLVLHYMKQLKHQKNLKVLVKLFVLLMFLQLNQLIVKQFLNQLMQHIIDFLLLKIIILKVVLVKLLWQH